MKTRANHSREFSSNKPLQVAFLITSMPVGGAEMLLDNLCRGMDRSRFQPHLICLKDLGPLGESLSKDIPAVSNLLRQKWDIRILWKLVKYFRRNNIGAIVTVGAGDKMFWGRLAASMAKVPVICSALHSTGWPDGVGRCNRWLTPITDAFIAVAEAHQQFLIDFEAFPAQKVAVIPNGVDPNRFCPDPSAAAEVRAELKIASRAPIVSIVAALRPEKNHTLFVDAANIILRSRPDTQFLIVGDGPEMGTVQNRILTHNIASNIHLLGSRKDTPRLLAASNVFALTSHNEANPVSILEALSTQVPVVSTRVGSIPETVRPGETGLLVTPGNVQEMAASILKLLDNPELASHCGKRGRDLVVQSWSLQSMIRGYENLLSSLYAAKIHGKKAPNLQLLHRQSLPVNQPAPLKTNTPELDKSAESKSAYSFVPQSALLPTNDLFVETQQAASSAHSGINVPV